MLGNAGQRVLCALPSAGRHGGLGDGDGRGGTGGAQGHSLLARVGFRVLPLLVLQECLSELWGPEPRG